MAAFDISKPIEERVEPDLITDYLIQRFSIAGTSDECVGRIKELEAAGIKRLLLTPPGAIYDQVMETWGRQVIPRA